MVDRDDISSRLGEITCPALVLHGELDAVFPIDVAQAWVAHLPGLAEFVRLPGAGHTANLENPSATNQALQRFLDTVT